MNKIIIFFIEGDTEEAFYKVLLEYLHNKCDNKQFPFNKVIVRNLKGIGNYKNRALRIFKKEILPKDGQSEYTIVLGYDTDIFELSRKPPVDWNDLESELKLAGANKVIHLCAKTSIEDWFLKDYDGILRYLNLPANTKVNSSNGIKKLEELFKKGKRIYIKGVRSKGFIEALNIDIIMNSICKDVKQLCTIMNINCIKK